MPYAIEPSTEISDRVDFALLCSARGYRYAVEVGVDMGVFARQMLSRWSTDQTYMHLVDDYGFDELFPWPRQMDMMTAALALLPWHGRYKFVQGRSPDCAQNVWWGIPPQFIYLDGNHGYEHLAAEMPVWWDKLAADGILAGHDYDPKLPGVIQAVNEFAESNGLIVRLTSEPDFPHSWYIYKNEPEVLHHLFFQKGDAQNPHFAGRGR